MPDTLIKVRALKTVQGENDIYYYQPSFEDIMERILDLGEGSTVYVDDIETYMPDYEIEEWLNDNEDTDD